MAFNPLVIQSGLGEFLESINSERLPMTKNICSLVEERYLCLLSGFFHHKCHQTKHSASCMSWKTIIFLQILLGELRFRALTKRR